MTTTATHFDDRIAQTRTMTDQPSKDPWTTRRLLEWMRITFEQREVESPRLVAELLLSHVLQCERMRLYMEVDRPASAQELVTLRPLVARAANHEPAQYLLGEGWFFGRAFEVDPSTLIPRPCTETIVEHVLHWARSNCPAAQMPMDKPPSVLDGGQIQTTPLLIADIGTGTGCIAISLARQLPMARVIATDISERAIELATRNARRHEVGDRISFACGDGLVPLEQLDQPMDIICSNPPYISDGHWDDIPANVRNYEPQSALRGGVDGLDVVRTLIASASRFMRAGGLLAVEIAFDQGDAAREMAMSSGAFDHVHVLRDLEQLERVLVAQRAAG